MCDTLEQEPAVTRKHYCSCQFNNVLKQVCVLLWWHLGSPCQLCDGTMLDGDSTIIHQTDSGIVQSQFVFRVISIEQQRHRACLSIVIFCSDLQEEPWTLWHKDESDERRQGRKETHKYEQPPAVHLKL